MAVYYNGSICDVHGSGREAYQILNNGNKVWTYEFVGDGNWTACSATCGGGTQYQGAICKRNDGVTKTNAFCNADGIATPTLSRPCNTQTCFDGTYYVRFDNYGNWYESNANGDWVRPLAADGSEWDRLYGPFTMSLQTGAPLYFRTNGNNNENKGAGIRFCFPYDDINKLRITVVKNYLGKNWPDVVYGATEDYFVDRCRTEGELNFYGGWEPWDWLVEIRLR